MEKYKKALESSAILWNDFLEVNEDANNIDDCKEVSQHIHAIQNIIMAKIGSRLLEDNGVKTNYVFKDIMGFMKV